VSEEGQKLCGKVKGKAVKQEVMSQLGNALSVTAGTAQQDSFGNMDSLNMATATTRGVYRVKGTIFAFCQKNSSAPMSVRHKMEELELRNTGCKTKPQKDCGRNGR
jgi:hypothetical protein